MKLRLGKRIAAICLSVVMLVAACFTEGFSTAVHVQAATEKEVTLGAGVLAVGCNTANAAKVWYGYSDTNTNKDKYMWRVVGYDRFGVAGTDGKMTLLADGNILVDTGYDDTDPYSNYYGGSTLESNVNAIAGELSGTELSAVSVRILTGGSANEDESGYDSDHISGNTVPDAVMWPLSAAEAYSLFESLRRLDGGSGLNWSIYNWWLRSPGRSADYAASVFDRGGVYTGGDSVDYCGNGVRPAFHLDLSSVIFSSLISGTAGGADAEYKLTVQDDQMNMELGAGGITWNGRTATVPYRISGVRAGSANRISAVITDGSWTGRGWSDEAAVKYYSKLNTGALPAPDANGEVTGTVSFTLPDDYDPSWDIYFLAENAHDLSNDSEKKCTDYASAPVAITRIVTLGTGVLEAGCNTDNAAKVWYGYDNTGTDPDIDKNKYVWRVVGYNGNSDGVAAEAGKMTLLANDNIIFDIYYDDTDPYSNYYGGSNLQSKVNAIAGELSGTELSAVSVRTLTGGSANRTETGYDPDHIRGNTVENAVMWPLSVAEADILPESLRRLDGGSGLNWSVYYWWLRSPGYSADRAARVGIDGFIYVNGDNVDSARNSSGVRPAFHLDLSSVIFSSLISGTAGTSDAEYKLTLKQDGSSMQIAANEYDALLYGNTFKVSYNITGSRSANRVSVMITDKAYTAADARILQYGKLNVYGTFGSTGSGTFTIDNSKVSGIWGTDFHVYILAEEVHLENEIRKTDYASAPIELTGPYVMGEHIHGFTYTQSTDGHSIDAVCTANGCTTTPVPNASLTISAPALTSYGGTESPEATLSGIADFNAATGLNISSADILYRGRNNTSYADTAAPTDPGEYTASITVNGITASVDYSIAQIPITITAASGTWVYDGTAHSNTTVEFTAGNLVTGDALVAEATGSVTNVSDTADGNNPVAAGYKIMRGTDDVTASYNITTVPGKLTITPLNISSATVTLNSSQLQYNDSEQTVGISSVIVNGTTLTEGVDYSISGNKATNKGDYTVTVTGQGNYAGSATAAWSITRKPVAAPQLGSADETVKGARDGKITGLTTAMEISSTAEDAGYTPVTDISGTGYAPGTYYIRYAGDDNHEVSPATTILIREGAEPNQDPVIPDPIVPDPVIPGPAPIVYIPDPTPTVTPEPEFDPDNYTRTIKNSDGSTTTRTVKKNEDGSTTVTEKTVYPDGRTVDSVTVRQEDGSFTTKSETTDASGNVISTTSIVSSIDSEGVTTRTTDTYNANGTSLNSILKTSPSHEVLYSYTKEVRFDRKGSIVVTADTINEDGTRVSKTYMSYGDGVKVSKFRSDKGTVSIPASITIAGRKVPVIAIAGGAFRNDLTLTKVKIGRNITIIGRNAFKGAKNLKSIVIYGNLTEVHKGAFKGIAPGATIKIKADKENYKRIVALIKASGISKTVKFKRVK